MVLVMCIVSCNKNDIQEEDVLHITYSDIPIGFNLSHNSNKTRGSLISTGELEFAVSAYHYPTDGGTRVQMMNEQTVSGTIGEDVWTYSPVIYWPTAGSMDFFSYAPASAPAREQFNKLIASHINHQAMLMECHVPASQVTTVNQLATLAGLPAEGPNDATNQNDLMFAFERNVNCAAQTIGNPTNMRFVHAMAGVRITANNTIATGAPVGTRKIVVGIGRLKTGGTLAICEPATPGTYPEVVWTLDGIEGTFYQTLSVDDGRTTVTVPADVFFFPPQAIDGGLTVTAYYYDSSDNRLDYRTITTDVTTLERGQVTTLNLK